ncbi:MAG: hypothetical protein KatS3mg111_0778 [Pirellulaceae bacterium]|nr:MAG: hypothetical protein KatS3mg111_0778 [Pirellulaceae bacterium]
MSDGVMAAWWLLVTAGSVVAGWVMAGRLYQAEPPSSRWLHASVLVVAQWVVVLTVLGAVGWLNGFLATVVMLVSSGLLVAWGRRLRPFDWPLATPEPRGAWLLWAAVATVLVGHMIVYGLGRFPDDFDCLMYHMPLIDMWIQTGSLWSTDLLRWSDAANSELVGLWFALPFSGDFLVPLNNLPIVVVWIAAAVELGRQMGLRRWWPHLAAVGCLAVYTTVHETDDASNDLMVAAMFLAAVAYLLRYWQSESAADRALFGITLGLLAGTKFLAVQYGLVVGALLAVGSWWQWGWRRAAWDSLRAVAISLPVGVFWYVRNFVLTGYPLYPSGSDALHDRILHPDISQTTLLFNDHPAVFELALDAVWQKAGPLHFVALLAIPAVCLELIFGSAKRREVAAARMIGWTVIGALWGGLAVVLVTPMLVEDQPETLNHLRWAYTPVRYSLGFLCLAVLGLAVFLQSLSELLPKVVGGLLAPVFLGGVGWQFLHHYWSYYDSRDSDFLAAVGWGGIVIAAVIISGQLVLLSRRHRGWVAAVVGAAWLVACSVGAQRLSTWWHDGLAAHFNTFYSTFVFHELYQPPKRILVLDKRPYAFFGSRRQNTIYQPWRYRGLEEVKRLMVERDLELVVTLVDTHRKLAPFRPVWDDLDASLDFEALPSGSRLRVYRAAVNPHVAGGTPANADAEDRDPPPDRVRREDDK